MKHQTHSTLPVQVIEPTILLEASSTPISHQTIAEVAVTTPTTLTVPTIITATPTIATPPTMTRRNQHHLVCSNGASSKLSNRRYQHHQQQHHRHHHQHLHHRRQQQQQPQHCQQRFSRPKVIRASEYKNLRQVVPSLRRQRDVGKVEVVTEAARYIDHLHKTLIERFVLCGIPDSLKGKLQSVSSPNNSNLRRLPTTGAGTVRE